MTGYATLATELRWLSDDDGLISQKMNEAADAIETLIRERDEALAEVERLKAAEIAGREVLLPMKREQAQRFAKEIEKEARAKAIDEAAAVTDGLILAGDYSIMKAHILSNAKAAILALKDAPPDPVK